MRRIECKKVAFTVPVNKVRTADLHKKRMARLRLKACLVSVFLVPSEVKNQAQPKPSEARSSRHPPSRSITDVDG